MKSAGEEIIHVVLALARGGDLDTLPSVVSGERLALAQELVSLLQSFDYLNSVAFRELTDGKPPPVVEAWKRRFSEPTKRTELREEFYARLRRLLAGSEVEGYLPPESAAKVASLRERLGALHAR